jgi:hypothetical protein
MWMRTASGASRRSRAEQLAGSGLGAAVTPMAPAVPLSPVRAPRAAAYHKIGSLRRVLVAGECAARASGRKFGRAVTPAAPLPSMEGDRSRWQDGSGGTVYVGFAQEGGGLCPQAVRGVLVARAEGASIPVLRPNQTVDRGHCGRRRGGRTGAPENVAHVTSDYWLPSPEKGGFCAKGCIDGAAIPKAPCTAQQTARREEWGMCRPLGVACFRPSGGGECHGRSE